VWLWKQYHEITKRLVAELGGPTNVVGDFAECLVAEHLGGRLLPPSAKSADIELPDKTRVQVKARVARKGVTTRSLGVIRSWDFAHLAVVLFDPDGMVGQAILIPSDTARQCAYRNSRQNGWTIRTTQAFLHQPQARDITGALNALLNDEVSEPVRPRRPVL